MLLKLQMKVDVDQLTKRFTTVLTMAIRDGRADWVRFLVRDLQADVNLLIQQNGRPTTYLTALMVREVE